MNIPKPILDQINNDPKLLSLLYDIGCMPEQCKTDKDIARLNGAYSMYRIMVLQSIDLVTKQQ